MTNCQCENVVRYEKKKILEEQIEGMEGIIAGLRKQLQALYPEIIPRSKALAPLYHPIYKHHPYPEILANAK
jgi:hypothetical protein